MAEEPSSNPLPPPPRGSSARQPLSNADFRRLADNPEELRKAKREADGAKKKSGSKPKWRPKKKTEEEEEEDKNKYRDRAKERREDANPDYIGAEQSLASLHSVAPPGQASYDVHRMTIENSKFLGGDVEHTHLVKGLDFALLQKIRAEQAKKDREEEEDDEETKAEKKKKKAAEKAKMMFRTATARSVYELLTETQHVKQALPVNEKFLTGRMTFEYELDEANDMPTTTYRSKEDCPKPPDHIVAGMDTAVLERLSKIMGYLRMGSAQGKAGKKLKKKEKAALLLQADDARQQLKSPPGTSLATNGAAAAAPVEVATARKEAAEDDIFGDVGTDWETGTANDTNKPTKTGALFDDMQEEDLGPMQGPARPPPKVAAAVAAAAAEQEQEATLGDMQGPARPPPRGGEGAGGGGVAVDPYTHAYPQPPPMAPVWTGQYDAYGQPVYMDPNVVAAMQIQMQMQQQQQQAGTYMQEPTFEELQEMQGAGAGGLTEADKALGKGSVYRRDDAEMKKRRETDVRERDPTFVSDSYAECYPGYSAYNTEIAGSDEEGDDPLALARGRGGKRGAGGEEEGEGARESRKLKEKKEKKFNSQLSKINSIIKKRKEGGDDGSVAGGLKLFDGSSKRSKI